MKSLSCLSTDYIKIFRNRRLDIAQKIRYAIDVARLCSMKKETIDEGKIFGFTIHYNRLDSLVHLLREIFIDFQYFVTVKKKNPVIFDVGSNIGIATLFFKMVYPESAIYSFEPDDAVFGFLKENIEGNGLKNITPINAGLGRYTGKAQFYVPSWSSGSSSIHYEKVEIESRYAGQCHGRENISIHQKEVDVMKVSDFIMEQGIRHIDLMKIDAEGAEAEIIEDVSEVFDRIGFIILEYHYSKDLLEKNSLASIISSLERADFLVSVKPTWFTNEPGVMCTYLVKAVNGRYLNDYEFDSTGTF
jgi:FkbM family methyltransferase